MSSPVSLLLFSQTETGLSSCSAHTLPPTGHSTLQRSEATLDLNFRIQKLHRHAGYYGSKERNGIERKGINSGGSLSQSPEISETTSMEVEEMDTKREELVTPTHAASRRIAIL